LEDVGLGRYAISSDYVLQRSKSVLAGVGGNCKMVAKKAALYVGFIARELAR